MKKKSIVFATLLTLFATVLGCFMPSIVSSVQDNRREAQVSRHESGSIQLVFADSISLGDKLMLIGSEYSRIDLDAGRNLEEDEVQQAALEMLGLLKEYGFSSVGALDSYTDVICSVFLATSIDDSMSSAIVWECNLSDDNGNEVMMLIDDETGKMVSFAYHQTSSINNYTPRFLDLLANYYGFAGSASDSSLDGPTIILVFTFIDWDGMSYEVPFQISPNSYYFNS